MASTPEFKASDLNRFDIKARDVIALAIVLKWTVRWVNSKRTTVSLRHGQKVILVPSTNVNANRARSWLNQILTHTPAAETALLIYGDVDLMSADPNVARVVAVAGTSMFTSAREAYAAKQQPDHLTQTVAETMPEQPEAITEALNAPEPGYPEGVEAVYPERQIESRVPFIVKRSENHSYESKGMDLITYTDGSTAYGCRFCDAVFPSSRGMGSHVGSQHKGMGTPDFLIEMKNKREDQPVTTPSPVPAPPPVESMLRGLPLLTHHLRTLMSRNEQARDVALGLASLDFETRARLAHVILMGKDSEQMRAAAEAAIEEMRQERDAAIAERDTALSKWTRFQELITEP